MGYNVNKMLSDGYTIDDIGSAMGYNVGKMKSDGYSEEDIIHAFENYKASGTADKPEKIDPSVFEHTQEPTQGQSDNTFDSNPSEFVQSRDNQSTIPRELSLGYGDTPVYKSADEISMDTKDRQNKAEDIQADKAFGASYIDPKTGKQVNLAPYDKGIEPTLDELNIIGGLSAKGVEMAIDGSHFLPTSKLSREAKILLRLNQGRMSEDQAVKFLKDIPKEDQAMALANHLDLAKNYFGHAVGADSILATKLGKQLEQRKNIIEPFVANEEDVIQAQKTFGEMKKKVDAEVPHMLDTTSLKEQLKPLEEYYKTDPSPLGTSIRNIMLDLSDDKISAGTVLDIKENINAMLRKSSVKKVYKTRKTLENIGKQLDTFRRGTFPKEISQRVDSEVAKYSDTVNRKLLGDIIDKNTKSDFAVDWDKVLVDAKKEGLSKQVSNQVVPVLKEFANRFHNDKYLSQAITPLGKQDNLNALGVWSKVLMETLNMANRVTYGVFAKSRYKDTLITNAIRKSIKKSDTYLDFVDDLVKKKVITPEDGEAVKLIGYKSDAKTTGDINVNPLTATEKGTISESPSAGILKERSDELIRDFVSKAGKSDKIAEQASKILQSNRLNEITRKISGQMKAEDAAGNAKMLQKIVTREANQLIKTINKSYGVQLPPEEADKIIKLKLNELMEDCK